MSRVDGRTVTSGHEATVDVVVVGSGPAGATVARACARAGATVAVVEAGPWIEPADAEISAFDSMAAGYRDMGASVLLGRAPIPYLQGRMVGGSSPINGGICWRLPRDVHREWVTRDPALGEALPWEELEAITDAVEHDLNVAPTDPAVAGRKNELMATGAEALGLEHRPIRRNVRGCRGLGRCIQGCPEGNKLSMDRSYLPDAEEAGAIVISSAPVRQILLERGRAVGVQGRAEGGGTVRVHARRAVVLAASAIQTPALLLSNRLRHGPVGRYLSCHPGVSLAGRFAEPVRMWDGATQGHEVTGLRSEGLKFEVLGFGLAVLGSRLEGTGLTLARQVADMEHWLDWGAAIKSSARGRVRVLAGRTVVTYGLSRRDVALMRRGLRVMGDMMFAAGAERVAPGVSGWAPEIGDPAGLADLEANGPRSPGAYTTAVTHMFGTCRMGSDPRTSVVRPDFRHHAVDGLYVADSSVFPSNTGVNPQIAIIALATLCARHVLGGAG